MPIEIPADHVLANEPELVKVWALFQSAWDQTEHNINSLFQVVSGMDHFSTQMIVAELDNSKALKIIRHLSSPTASPSILYPTNNKTKESVTYFAKKLEKLNEKRNRLIHGKWVTHTDGKTGKVEVKRVTNRPNMFDTLTKEIYTSSKEDILELVGLLEKTSLEINQFTGPIIGHRIQHAGEVMLKLWG